MMSRMAGAVPLLLLVFGCARGPGPSAPVPTDAPPTPNQLMGRLDAAGRMPDLAERGNALRAIAEDAADLGSLDLVTRALDGITDPGTRNEASANCALKLAKRGDQKNANAIAARITNPSKRATVLNRITKGG